MPIPLIRRLALATEQEKFDAPLLLGEVAIVFWVTQVCIIFGGMNLPWWPEAFWLALVGSAISWRLGLHQRSRAGAAFILRSLAVAPLLALVIFAGLALVGFEVSPATAFWIGSAIALLFLAFHLCFGAARARWPDAPLEIFRWLAMAAAAIALLLPFYGRHGFGSGDVNWYVAMLADVIVQIRHGVFPVWVGQSEYAFNGAMSPLRLAPLFQYAGGLLDLLTCHVLDPLTLANAVVSAFGLLTAASAYAAIRLALPKRPNLACLLALLWLACPGVLAPLYAGFQYMEWIAMPFLPIMAYGCWRLWVHDDRPARLAIVAGLAGMMLAHTPTALWGGLFAAGIYLAHAVVRKNWRAQAVQIAGMAAVFAILGGFPIGSVFAIDNRASMAGSGHPASVGLEAIFPDNFRPINLNDMGLKSYQLGYALIAVALLALILLAWLRPRGGLVFIGTILVVIPLTTPVPGLTNWIWAHVPGIVITITNSPPQRLFEFWAIFIVFAFVLAMSDSRLVRRRGLEAGILLSLALGGLWSAREAAKMVGGLAPTFVGAADAAIGLRPENLQLARYAYATFAHAPGYASHGHVDPLLENRLLDASGRTVLAANADAAAPQLRADSDIANVPRLIQAGRWLATSDNHRPIYKLAPSLRLESGQAYALRLEFIHPEKEGVLQIVTPEMFREYLLPDSGIGLAPSSLAFGALPTSSPVVSLQQGAGKAATPEARFVAPISYGEEFEFARFWLFTYDLADLPVRVSSWIPYRAETETALPAFLETPRIWQRGWEAKVNGRRVVTRESAQHLVMVPLAPGTSEVELRYRPPLWLAGWFWLAVLGWILLLGGTVRQISRPTATA